MDKQELLKRIPKVDEVLKDQRLFVFFGDTPRELVVESVREAVDELRKEILDWDGGDPPVINMDNLIDDVVKKVRGKKQKSLRRVINGTGTILHTNLGRARMSEEAGRNVLEAAMNYSTLEYDLKRGARGSRHDHIEKLIAKIVGTEGAMVVNNNASAVLLCLSALAKGKEVIVSRGELVEIGGSFRIPEIMELGGAYLREVGTTNKTKLDDYRSVIDKEKTGALLKVHTSNYKIMGFTAEVSLSELSTLGQEWGIPVVYDLGSGLMADLQQYGIDEPTVPESIRNGADVVTFSGDKLLGGPQAGIIIGKKQYIDSMKKHPLARAVRVDKMTIAALEATFREYFDMEKAKEKVPVLSMITVSMDEMRTKAILLAEQVRRATEAFEIEVIKSEGQIGGGSTPNQFLVGYAVSVVGKKVSADRIERDLRAYEVPVIVRINQDRVLIDMRTVTRDEIDMVARALIACGEKYGRG
ncbi:MAG: L-seryl-tRNA(Sec) selenium transferase [Clostridiales Family XIII bacterium]|jgi:L-seryl-tRNA(Ser) seleniumtransferase|nr:L-seryl-tRNA(Sec) selenium transferase [Clostridiales Family XIII bacterium]